MNNLKFLAITFVIIVLQTNLKGQISYSDNTISPTALFPSALGNSNTVNGNFALVGGLNSSANGAYSLGFGNASFAIGDYSFAFGYQSEATKEYAIAMGYKAKATESSAIAIGLDVQIPVPQAIGIGRNVRSYAGGGYIIGMGLGLNKPFINNVAYSLMIGFNSTRPTFFVGSSAGDTASGKIGIGNITNPTAKLHLLSDDGEAADLKLEHRTTGFRQYSQIYLGTHTIRAGNSENMVFTTPTSKHFAFITGKVGVGTTEPVAKLQITDGDVYIEDIGSGIIMKSPDGQCWRGKLSNIGVLEFNPIDCENLTAAIKAPEKNSEEFQVFPNPSAGLCTVIIPNTNMGASLNIYNMDGVCLLKKTITANNSYLDLTHFAKGTYLVEFVAEGMQKRNQTLILN
jgi:hypothetical protein